jgi:hypothetical protein
MEGENVLQESKQSLLSPCEAYLALQEKSAFTSAPRVACWVYRFLLFTQQRIKQNGDTGREMYLPHNQFTCFNTDLIKIIEIYGRAVKCIEKLHHSGNVRERSRLYHFMN